MKAIGRRIPRVDALEEVTGVAKFCPLSTRRLLSPVDFSWYTRIIKWVVLSEVLSGNLCSGITDGYDS